MKITICVLIALFAAIAHGQSVSAPKLPADVFPDSLSRLPVVKRDALDDNGKRIYDLVVGANRGTVLRGPGGVTMHSPKMAEPVQMLNTYLRNESVVGRRFFELCVLITARELDSQYEWTAHEAAALEAGVPGSVVDVVKHRKAVKGLDEKDATVIRLGRALFRDHKVSSDLYAKTVALFGQQGALELSAVMGDYAMAAVMLTMVDHQLSPDRKPLLPVR